MPEGTSDYGFPVYGSGGSRMDVQELPSVTVTGPSGPVSSLPYSVTWDYSHPAAVPQSEYKVEVLRQDGTLVYSSGWVQSAATQHAIDGRYGLVDLPDAVIRVTVAAANRGYQAADDLSPVVFQFGQPSVVWVVPSKQNPHVNEAYPTVEWQYSDTGNIPQAAWRLVLEFNGEVVYQFPQQGWEPGPATSHKITGYFLSGGSRYRLGVMVQNTNGVESEGA